MRYSTLKRTSWIVMVAFLIASFIVAMPNPSYAISLDTIATKLAGYGVPALVLVYLVATCGVAGGAIITTVLSTLGGPLGMMGGIAMLILIKEVSEYLASYGMSTIMHAVARQLRQDGKSNYEIKREIEGYPISRSMKKEILYELGL